MAVTINAPKYVYYESHAERRRAILAQHPEVRTLFGYDPREKYFALCVMTAQLTLAYYAVSLAWWQILLLAYCVGGFLSQSIPLAFHETAHNLMFKKTLHNNLFAMFVNIPIVIPSAFTFKRYHLEHHTHTGEKGVDVDLPSDAEIRIVNTRFRKFIWLLLMPFFYGLRPIFVRPKKPNIWEVINYLVQALFVVFTIMFFGQKFVLYLLASSLLTMGVHPMAGHFVSEHFLFKKGQETYSYYGPLNWITYNVGYHNEHHDFPYISGFRLKQVREMAPTFYEGLHCYQSWTCLLYDFVCRPDITLGSRAWLEPKVRIGQALPDTH